ncbi:MAG: hypothetical protein GY949_22590 [Gammaproteobacteria bacterium]|nr:hypothetical protein [Gammaproteobacteria bacterium]
MNITWLFATRESIHEIPEYRVVAVDVFRPRFGRDEGNVMKDGQHHAAVEEVKPEQPAQIVVLV